MIHWASSTSLRRLAAFGIPGITKAYFGESGFYLRINEKWREVGWGDDPTDPIFTFVDWAENKEYRYPTSGSFSAVSTLWSIFHIRTYSYVMPYTCQRELVMAIGGFSNWSDSCFSL